MWVAKIKVEVLGFTEALETLDSAVERSRDVLADVVRDTTFSAGRRMLAGAPRGQTGRLKSALDTTVRGLSGKVVIGRDAYYWRFLEYGTRYIAANPVFRTARELELAEFPRRVRIAADSLDRQLSTSRFS